MIYDIRLRIGYDYPSAVRDARHMLRVRPRADAFQRVEALGVKCSPVPDETAVEEDFFGNGVDPIALYGRHASLGVEMRARVRVRRPVPALDSGLPSAEIQRLAGASCDASPRGPLHFLGASRLVSPEGGIAPYAARLLARAPTAGEGALALARAIQADFDYAPGTTDVRTTVEAAFRARRGVCQDFAHLMIAGLRACGIPAAYVSGFLRTLPPPGQERLEGADAMHAWIEAWLGPELGWIGFDPTNGVVASSDHVVVAIGRDYADVAPIDGVLITAGPQSTYHRVDVVPIEEIVASG